MKQLWLELCRWVRLTFKQAIRPFAGAVSIESALYATVLRGDGSVEDLGLISTKLVTDAYVDFIVDNLVADTTEFGDLKFHDSGTGAVAENVADTDLGTKVETGRVTGTQLEGGSTNIYRSVGTIAYTATRAITEHGIFTITAAGTLGDRSVFTAINVISGDSIQFTYELTFPSGG